MIRLRLALLALTLRLLSLLPAGLLWVLSRPLGGLIWRTARTRRNTTQRNLAACYPSMETAEREALGRASIRHFAMTLLESGMCWNWSTRRLERRFEAPIGMELLEAAMAEGRGLLVLVPHFGNWELLNHWVQHRWRLTGLYKPGRSPEVEAWLARNRCRFGARMVPTTAAGLRQLYGEARSGKLVAILPDQDPSGGQGRFAPFFGVPALTGVLASRLVRQTGCRVLFGAVRRIRGGRYRAHFLTADEGIHSADLDQSLAALNRGVERIVMLEPAQYLWAYKRFKSRPPGALPFY